MRTRIALVGLAILLAGCGAGVDPAPSVPAPSSTTLPQPDGYLELEAARDRWSRAALDSYHYVFANDCGECDPLLSAPRRVVVWGSEQYDAGRLAPSVEEIFDDIEEALDAGRTVEVTFDEQLGYPTDVAIDMEYRPVDGGTHWVVDELEPGLPGDEVSSSVVAAAENRWLNSRPAAYEYTLSVFCDCPLEGSVVTKVDGDRIVGFDILYDESTGRTITPLAVDQMFSDLADLMASVDGVVEGGIRFTGSARFHPDLGYPIWIGLDIEVLEDDPALAGLPARMVVTMTDLHPIQPGS